MPDDFIIVTGDMIQVMIPPPTVVPMLAAPVPLIGTSQNVVVGGKPYAWRATSSALAQGAAALTAPPFAIPGMGTLEVTLMPNNKTMQTENGREDLVQGRHLRREVQRPDARAAADPHRRVPDSGGVKPGKPQFVTTNMQTMARLSHACRTDGCADLSQLVDSISPLLWKAARPETGGEADTDKEVGRS